jgi:hypothetical protein
MSPFGILELELVDLVLELLQGNSPSVQLRL